METIKSTKADKKKITNEDLEKIISLLELNIMKLSRKLEITNDSYVTGIIEVKSMVKELENLIQSIGLIPKTVYLCPECGGVNSHLEECPNEEKVLCNVCGFVDGHHPACLNIENPNA